MNLQQPLKANQLKKIVKLKETVMENLDLKRGLLQQDRREGEQNKKEMDKMIDTSENGDIDRKDGLLMRNVLFLFDYVYQIIFLLL